MPQSPGVQSPTLGGLNPNLRGQKPQPRGANPNLEGQKSQPRGSKIPTSGSNVKNSRVLYKQNFIFSLTDSADALHAEFPSPQADFDHILQTDF